jgi:predicted dehydrogenase
MSTGPVGVGIVGAGVISGQYLRALTSFPDIRVLGIADLDIPRAEAVAREYRVPVAGDAEAVLAISEVEIILNLTVPAAHAEVAAAALLAGKHVYGEKPLTRTPAEAEKLLAEAAQRGLRIGGAPDTFLGAGIQSAKRALDSGIIGTPVAATTVTQGAGPEGWHPNPAFFYQPGGGPLFDLGPYYLTALVALFGPIARVAATARRAHAERVAPAGPAAGARFPVDVDTHVTALLEFASGPSAAATFSFDSVLSRGLFEITGTEGTLAVPDPNMFGGPVLVRTRGDEDWRALPVEGSEAGRGLGVLEMARAIRAGVPHRASGTLAAHVLETMTAITESAEHREFRDIYTAVSQPDALPTAWDPYAATLGTGPETPQ